MDVSVDLHLSYLNTIKNFCFGFSIMGIFETISVFLLILYICTRTRASSVITKMASDWMWIIPINRYPIPFNNKRFEFLTSFYNKEERSSNTVVGQHGVQDLLRVTQHAGRKPYSSLFDWGIYFPHLAQCVRLKKYPYPQVSDDVLKDIKLQRAIKQAAEEILRENRTKTTNSYSILNKDTDTIEDEANNYQKIIRLQEKRAKSIVYNMRSKISDMLLRITSWLLYKLLPCFLSGIVTHTKQIEMLKTAHDKASGIPLIFLPLHRSHLDYIMISFILLNNDIKSPIVAAGNNLQIPIFGSLLRGLGGFFIKRKIDPVVGKKDILYRAALHLYLQHALEAGHNLEFFIEGGRTRTGKPCMPKNGILSVIVSAFMDGTISDALLVPVSLNYERLVDGNFVREQLGRKKVPETFRSAMSGIWKVLNSNYGLMRIDFNQPFSLKELVQSYNKIAEEEGNSKIYKPASKQLQHNQSSSSLYGTDVVCEEHRSLVDSISRQVIYDCVEATSVMTTNALSFLLLTRFRDGTFEDTIAKELDNLRNELKYRKDIGFSGNSLNIVRYAVDLLGPDLVSRTKTECKRWFIKPSTDISHIIELSYYSNTLTPHFALESIVVTALWSYLHKKEKGSGISRRQLREACIDHCEILRYEFILNKPTQNLEKCIEETIDYLCQKELISLPKVEGEKYSETKKLTNYDIEDDDDIDYENDIEDDKPEIFLTPERKTEQNALISVLAPFGHTYLAVVNSLQHLLSGSLLESDFIKYALDEINTNVTNGKCKYGESISTDSIRNCIKFLEKLSAVEVCCQHGVRLLSLGNLCDTSYGIKNIIDRIQSIVPPEIQ